MALEKVITYSHNVTENGHIEVKEITRIIEDGKMLSKSYKRHVVAPGADTSNEDERTKEIASVVHTKDVIAAYEALVASHEDK